LLVVYEKFDQGGLTLSDRSDYLQNETTSPLINTFKLYMTKMALLFNVSQENAKQFSESTFNFEKELAEVKKTAEIDPIIC